jgi:hypothetical protein
MRYYSAKGFIVFAAIILVAVMAIFSLVTQVYVAAIISGLALILFLWIWFDTYYVISDKELLYKSGFIKGAINIDSIYEIERNKTRYSGIRPSLSMKGLIVKYNKYDDIYLSPKDADGFLEALKQVNPNIKIV